MNCGPYRETKLNDSFREEVQRVVDLISSVSGMNWLKSDDAEVVHAYQRPEEATDELEASRSGSVLRYRDKCVLWNELYS
jgi:hypothetical protein